MYLDVKRNMPGVLSVIEQWIEEHTPDPSQEGIGTKIVEKREWGTVHKIIKFLTINYLAASGGEYDPKRLKIYIFTLSIEKTFSK